MRNREIERQVTAKEIYFWNAFGSGWNAASTVLLLLAVTRILGPEQGGIFSIAMALAQQMLTISSFETGTYQLTDGKNVFPFGVYMSAKFLLFAVSMAAAAAAAVPKYTPYKLAVVLLMCFYKGMGAFGTTFSAVFQKNGRLDIGGKSLMFRVVCSSVLFVAAIWIFDDLLAGAAFAAGFSVLWLIFYDIRYTACFEKIRPIWSGGRIFRLLSACFPLFLGAFLMTYICNQPKYVIDGLLSEEAQNSFAILFMPSAVVNLLGMFIYRPLLTQLTAQWNGGRLADFVKTIAKVAGLLAVLVGVCLTAAWFFGIPVLSLVYGVDLSGCRSVLMLVLLGGGLYAAASLLYNAVVILRRQVLSFFAYLFGYALSLFITKPLVVKFGLLGAAASYLIAMAGLVVCLLLLFSVFVFRAKDAAA